MPEPMPPGPVSDPTPQVVQDDGCTEPEWYPFGRLQAAGGVYLMQPYFTSNPAFKITTTSAANVDHEAPSFDYGLGAAPLVCLIWPGDNGLGIRGRWWYFDQSSHLDAINGTNPASAVTSVAVGGLSLSSPSTVQLQSGVADEFAFSSTLKVLVLDVEATQDVRCADWLFVFGLGGRYAHLSQNYDAWQANPGATGGAVVACLHAGHNFNGAGPTLSSELVHPLWNTRLSLYGNARASFLYGHQSQHAALETMQNGGSFVDSTSGGDGLLPVLEFELGVQYTSDMGDWRPFVRAGLVSQTWFNAGNATSTGGNMGFLGLVTTAGFAF